jgi:hypothetical protein
MARVRLTPVDLPKTHPGASVAYTFATADTADHNDFLLTGREVLLISNGGASPVDVTVGSVADPYGRTGDLTLTVAAGATRAIAFLDRAGWMQSDGALYLNTTSTDISYAVLRLPA